MIHWDKSGIKGKLEHYDVQLVPFGEGWMSVVWVGKTHIRSLPVVDSKMVAQEETENYLEELTKATSRLMERLNFDSEDFEDDEGE